MELTTINTHNAAVRRRLYREYSLAEMTEQFRLRQMSAYRVATYINSRPGLLQLLYNQFRAEVLSAARWASVFTNVQLYHRGHALRFYRWYGTTVTWEHIETGLAPYIVHRIGRFWLSSCDISFIFTTEPRACR